MQDEGMGEEEAEYRITEGELIDRLDDSARRFVFCTYRVFDQLLKENHDLKAKCAELCDDYGVLVANLIDLIQFEPSLGEIEELTNLMNTILNFTRLFRLCNIIYLGDGGVADYGQVLLWLQDIGEKCWSPWDDETEWTKFKNHIQPEECFPEFWRTIYSLVLHGYMWEAGELLSCHSEVRASEELKSLVSIVFSSHPLFNLMVAEQEATNSTTDVDYNPRIMGEEWILWRRRVEELGTTRLASIVPELIPLINLLLGEDNHTLEHCGKKWEKFTIAKILYKAPPSLSMPAIAFLIESIEQNKHEGELGELHTLIINLLSGRFGELFKHFYEYFFKTSNTFSSQIGSGVIDPSIDNCIDKIASVFQLAVVHMAHILTRVGALEGERELDTIEFSLGSSLVEELTLIAVETISTMGLPIEILCCYLNSCSQNGAHFARALLLRRKVHAS